LFQKIRLKHYGPLRMVRDVFHVSGFLLFDPVDHLVQISLNQDVLLARTLLNSLRTPLAPMRIVISLAKLKGCTKRPVEAFEEHQARWGNMVK
jgi:hypothetical protein